MSPSFNLETNPPQIVDRPMCAENVARRWCISSRSIRWAAEHAHLKGLRDPSTSQMRIPTMWMGRSAAM
jgi:hypothetical protein